MNYLRYIGKGLDEMNRLSKTISESSGISPFRIKADMIKCALLYGARPSDYFFFSFHEKSKWERNRYMTNGRWLKLLKITQLNNGRLANAKDKEYQLFSSFIKRDWTLFKKENDNTDTLMSFLESHGDCIAKPIHGTLGRGLVKISKNDDLTELKDLLRQDDYLLEECAVNDEEIKRLNPSSLNTFRVFTHVTNLGEIILDEIILRVGKAGNVVDNWGAGGIIYYVDINSGIVTKPGVDKHMNTYLYHPCSDIQMIGYKVQGFEELKQYVLSLCKVVPDARVVGWDEAKTPDGFDFIELNCPGGHDILQAFNVPFWDVFKKIK